MTPSPSCPAVEDLQRLLSGQMPDREADALERHLLECPSCLRAVQGLHGEDTLVAAVQAAAGLTGGAAPGPVPELMRRLKRLQPDSANRPTTPEPQRTSPVVPEVPAALAGHPRYRVQGLLGAGGMGAVYKAEHLLMGRTVALKVINRDLTGAPAMVERFVREVKAAARLAHPNIVTAFDADQAGDTHFLVMEYVEGASLAKRVQECGPLPVREACDYVRQAALGLQYAWERGMVHRDVKPQNLMLTPDGQVKVLDFGLARFAAEAAPAASSSAAAAAPGPAALTQVGAVLGTPDYIAPEQAVSPQTADVRADVYSLGCTLYDLLTGQPPFPDGTALEKVQAHVGRAPRPLAEVRPDVPAGLARVVEKMMAKSPADRYQTPAEAAAALEPFARAARPRRRWPAAAAAGLLAALALVVYLAARPAGPPSPPDKERLQGTWIAVAAEHDGRPTDAGDYRITFEGDAYRSERDGGDVNNGTFRLDLTTSPPGIVLLTTEGPCQGLGREGIYALEGDRLRLLFFSGQARPTEFATRPGSRTMLMELRRGGDTPAPPDESVRRFEGHTSSVKAVAFSPDGTQILSGGGYPVGRDFTLRLWDVETGEELRRFEGHQRFVMGVSFSPDGRRALSAGSDARLRLWDVEAGRELKVLDPQMPAYVNSVAFLPDGLRAVSGGAGDARLRLWDVEAGRVLRTFERHKGIICAVAVSPDGRRALSGGGEKVVRLWDVAEEKAVQVFEGHTALVEGVAFVPDGRRVLSGGGADRTARLWDAETGEELVRYEGHAAVFGVAVSPDGRRVLAAGGDGMVRLWDLESGRELRAFRGHRGRVWSVAFSPDGGWAVSGSADTTVRLWQLPRPH